VRASLDAQVVVDVVLLMTGWSAFGPVSIVLFCKTRFGGVFDDIQRCASGL
jgi:hypothetical protein